MVRESERVREKSRSRRSGVRMCKTVDGTIWSDCTFGVWGLIDKREARCMLCHSTYHLI